MKKLIIALCMLVTCCTYCFAATRTYEIDNYEIFLDIQKNGDLSVQENITYDFTGSFNGVYRNIDLGKGLVDKGVLPGSSIYSPESVEIQSISLEKQDATYETLKEDAGGVNYYTVEDLDREKKIKIYMPASNEKRTVILKYTYKGAAVTHKDCSEIYGNFFANEAKIRNAMLRVNTQNLDKTSFFVHTTGDVISQKQDYMAYKVNVQNLGKKDLFDVRIVMPKEVCVNSSKKTGMSTLDRIRKIEGTLEKEESITKAKTTTAVILCVLLGGYVFLVVYKVYKGNFVKYDKEIRPLFTEKYFPDIPNDKRNVAEAACLINDGSVSSQIVIAILFDLVDKKKLKLDPRKVIDKKGKVKYEYYVSKKADLLELDKYEKNVIDLFFKDKEEINLNARLKQMEKEDSVYEKVEKITKEITQKYQKEYKEKVKINPRDIYPRGFMWMLASVFVVMFLVLFSPENTLLLMDKKILPLFSLAWHKYGYLLLSGIVGGGIAILAATLNKKVEKYSFFVILNTTLMAVASLLIYVLAWRNLHSVAFVCSIYTMLIGNAITTIHSILFADRLKAEYVEEKARWIGVKNYINDYSLLKEKEAAHVINWEKYMVVAMAFGIADKVKKELELIYPDGEMPYYYGYYGSYNSYNRMYSHVYSSVMANSSISTSSSGGFSGGGGGGFGGSGGAF